MKIFATGKTVWIDVQDLVSIDGQIHISTGTLTLRSSQVFDLVNRLTLDGLTHTYIDTANVRIEDVYLDANEDREHECTLIGENDGTLILEVIWTGDPQCRTTRFVLDRLIVEQLVHKCIKMINEHIEQLDPKYW